MKGGERRPAQSSPRSYWNDLRHHLGDSVEASFWLSDPLVWRRVNERVSGDPERWPADWLREYLAPVSPFPRALSLGCGTGNLERDLCRKRIVQSIVGVDTAPDVVDYARAESGREGFGPEQIDFVVAEAPGIPRIQ
jgi:SAM-dependent methyltransferase